jgi:1-acyl-sn-glycerol-3-phosphate acyltransferase
VRKLRSALILLTFLIFTLPLMPVQLGLRFIAPRMARGFPHWYHRLLCRILGVTIHCHGAVAEDRPVLLVSNHISWLDIIVLSAVAPLSFVAKSEVGTWPFISWLAKLQGTLFINREDRLGAGDSARKIMARLRTGDHIVIFAEGTSSDGNVVLPFKTSLFAAAKPRGEDAHALQHGIYVQSIAIAYTHQQGLALCRRGRPIVAWYGDMDIASHAWELLKRGPLDVSLRIGPPVELEAFADRKALAHHTDRDVRGAVADFLFPRYSGQADMAMDVKRNTD